MKKDKQFHLRYYLNRVLPHCFDLIEAYGFLYSQMVWMLNNGQYSQMVRWIKSAGQFHSLKSYKDEKFAMRALSVHKLIFKQMISWSKFSK